MKKTIFIILIILPLLLGSIFSYAENQKSSELINSAKKLVTLLAKEDYTSVIGGFDGSVKKTITKEKISELWKSLINNVGKYEKQIYARFEETNKYNFVFVTCKFEKTNVDIRVGFVNKKIVLLSLLPGSDVYKYKTPGYVSMGSFKEKDIMIGDGQWKLPGTLSIPKGVGPFSLLILIHGSGPNDRDETIGANKVFRDIAWGLASQGIAVFRYEKRSKYYPEGWNDNWTVKEEVVDDALGAVSSLRNINEIDPNNIFLLGHSLGGKLIPRIGVLDKGIKGFIIMAGTPLRLEDKVLEQTIYICSLDGKISKEEKEAIDKIREQVKNVKDPKLSEKMPSSSLPFGISAQYWLDLRKYSAIKAAKDIDRPILILHGGRDYQCTLKDFNEWKKNLSSQKNVEFKLYPKLNHLFIEGEGVSSPNEYSIPGHVLKEVLDDISTWVRK